MKNICRKVFILAGFSSWFTVWLTSVWLTYVIGAMQTNSANRQSEDT